MKKSYIGIVYVACLLVTTLLYIWLRIDNTSTIEKPRKYPDSKVYLSVSTNPISVENNWKARVPLVIPLVYKILGSDINKIVHFQTGFSIFAWILLSLSATIFFDGKIFKWLIYSSVLFFSLSAEILVYDYCILSESISLSLMILHIAAWMLFVANKNPNWYSTALVILTGTIWIFTRDTNSVLILGLSILILGYSLIRKTSLNLKIIGIVLIGMCILSSNSGSSSGRWIPPNIKVIEQRILTNEANLTFYKANGMPVNETLLELAGRKEGSINSYFTTPELEEFVQWHKENGKRVYVKYLLSDPKKFFFEPINNINILVNSNPIFYYSPRGLNKILPEGIGNLVFFKFFNSSIIVSTVISILLGLVIYLWKKKVCFEIPLVMALLLYPHALIVWTASGGDVSRHAYQFRIQYRLTLIFLIIYILGNFAEWFIKRFYSTLVKGKKIILISGVVLSVLSLTADLILNTGDKFSLGYAQIALLATGFLFIVGGIFLHLSPEKLQIALLGITAKGPINTAVDM